MSVRAAAEGKIFWAIYLSGCSSTPSNHPRLKIRGGGKRKGAPQISAKITKTIRITGEKVQSWETKWATRMVCLVDVETIFYRAKYHVAGRAKKDNGWPKNKGQTIFLKSLINESDTVELKRSFCCSCLVTRTSKAFYGFLKIFGMSRDALHYLLGLFRRLLHSISFFSYLMFGWDNSREVGRSNGLPMDRWSKRPKGRKPTRRGRPPTPSSWGGRSSPAPKEKFKRKGAPDTWPCGRSKRHVGEIGALTFSTIHAGQWFTLKPRCSCTHFVTR